MESLVDYQKRLGDPNAVLPLPPTRPTQPPPMADKHLFPRYRWDLDRYNTYKYWDKDVIKVLTVIFPHGLTDKEIDTAGMLPLSLTGRQALDHIEAKTKTDIVATGAYCKILMQRMMRKYLPNGNGSVQYFKDMKHDQVGANVLTDDDAMVSSLLCRNKHSFSVGTQRLTLRT